MYIFKFARKTGNRDSWTPCLHPGSKRVRERRLGESLSSERSLHHFPPCPLSLPREASRTVGRVWLGVWPSPGMAVPCLVRKAQRGALFSSACPDPEFPFRDTQTPTSVVKTSLIFPSPQRFPSRRQSLKAASAPRGSLDGRTGSLVRDFFIWGDLLQRVFVLPPWVFIQLWVKIPFAGERWL